MAVRAGESSNRCNELVGGFMNDTSLNGATVKKGFSGKQVFLIILVTILVATVLTYFVLQRFVFAKEFKPIHLSQTETVVLNEKLQALGFQPDITDASDESKKKKSLWGSRDKKEEDTKAHESVLSPEAYSEDASKREINFSEKELNAMLAKNTDMANRVAIDLANDLASAKMLIPMDSDFPFIGGKTLRVNTGLGLSFTNDRPVVILKGVSIMGVPIPNAWLGNLKNVDLVQEFGLESGFWKAFAAGVDYINVKDGMLQIKLKE
ncbi:MAG: arginine N-succinyltransferase [Gammaproteobacteria bacterium]